ncbi:6445_t:CDS:2, partial [Paraglomus occultum]
MKWICSVTINFVTRDGEKTSVRANIGDSIMDITQANNIDLECACEGSLACSTCHVVVDPAYYDKLDEPTDEENDMLDLAFGLTETLVFKDDLYTFDKTEDASVNTYKE